MVGVKNNLVFTKTFSLAFNRDEKVPTSDYGKYVIIFNVGISNEVKSSLLEK